VKNSPRRPWLAAALSLVTPGLGHLYCGRARRGAVLLALAAVFAPAAWLAALPPPSGAKLVLLIGSAFAVPAAILLGAADAFRVARRLRTDFSPRRWQGLAVYAVFAALGLGALCLPLLVRRHAIEAFRIATGSMEPALVKGDLVLVSKLGPARASLRRGDIVVFRAPGEGSRAYVKRVAAVAGDVVAIRDGRILVNEATGSPPATTVPADHVFVLGDDLAHSRDSRVFGPVPSAGVIGVVFYRLCPPRAGPFGGR
jgi:signal peptidase I